MKLKFYKIIDYIIWKHICISSSFIMNFLLYINSIKCHGAKFYGLTKIKKHSNSHIKIGNNCTFRSLPTSNLIGINRPCIISTHSDESKIIIGENCGMSGTVIGAFSKITLGNNVRCGANTLITDSNWHLDDPRSGKPRPIIIEDNVWLGVNVIVLKGVTIGMNSIIGAGSVVTKDIPSNCIAAGNPCKIIRTIEPSTI